MPNERDEAEEVRLAREVLDRRKPVTDEQLIQADVSFSPVNELRYGFTDEDRQTVAAYMEFAGHNAPTLAAAVIRLSEEIRGRDAELLRIRTAHTNAAVEIEKIRIDLGIINDPEVSTVDAVRKLAAALSPEVSP